MLFLWLSILTVFMKIIAHFGWDYKKFIFCPGHKISDPLDGILLHLGGHVRVGIQREPAK
jgi:hypothetical protein